MGLAEAEATRQKGLAEAESMMKKAEAYQKYNNAAMAEMMIKVLPDVARSVAEPLKSIDKVSIIGGDASGVAGISGNVPVLMAQTMQAMKEATGIDMADIIRSGSIQAKTDRNININGVPENLGAGAKDVTVKVEVPSDTVAGHTLKSAGDQAPKK